MNLQLANLVCVSFCGHNVDASGSISLLTSNIKLVSAPNCSSLTFEALLLFYNPLSLSRHVRRIWGSLSFPSKDAPHCALSTLPNEENGVESAKVASLVSHLRLPTFIPRCCVSIHFLLASLSVVLGLFTLTESFSYIWNKRIRCNATDSLNMTSTSTPTSPAGEGHLEHRFSRLTMIGLTFGILKYGPFNFSSFFGSSDQRTALGYVLPVH